MSDPAVTPLAAAELARAKLKQREDAIRAAAIRQGREAERKELEADRVRLEGQHAGEIAGIKQAHLAELDRAVVMASRAARWFGALIGLCAGAILASGGYLLLVDRAMNSAFDRAQEISAASTLVGAATQRRDEPATGEPIRRAP